MRPADAATQPIAYDAKRLAAALSISTDAARKLINGPLYSKRVRIGRRVLVRREAVEQYIESREGV